MTAPRCFARLAAVGTAAAAMIVLSPANATSEGPASGRRPNFLIFYTDDQPQSGVGCYGNPHIRTPNMDRLAAEGTLFENSFVTTAICCSSRASILTGQHMRRHGIRDFTTPLSAEALAQTFPVLLRKAGYRTGYLGKYAVGTGGKDDPERKKLALPADQFDLWYGLGQTLVFKQIVDGKPRYLTTIMTEKATAFLKEQPKDRPFCLIVALKEPHGPQDYFDPEYPNPYVNALIPPPANMTAQSHAKLPASVRAGLNSNDEAQAWLRNPQRYLKDIRREYGYISRADHAVGVITAALKEAGLDDNTVIIHTSDNGSFEGAHGLIGKWLMYEESIRVPLIVRDPRLPREKHGQRSRAMVLNIDVAPTVLAMAGVPVPASMQGTDLQPLLRAPQSPGREDWYYEHTFTPAPGVQMPIPASEGVRTDRWKYIRYTDANPPLEQLFDLAADPHEETDLAREAAHAERLAALRARCDEYRRRLP